MQKKVVPRGGTTDTRISVGLGVFQGVSGCFKSLGRRLILLQNHYAIRFSPPQPISSKQLLLQNPDDTQQGKSPQRVKWLL